MSNFNWIQRSYLILHGERVGGKVVSGVGMVVGRVKTSRSFRGGQGRVHTSGRLVA